MKTVVGMFERQDEARRAIEALQDAGFDSDQIGVAMRDERSSAVMAASTGAGDLTEEGATAGAVSGAGVGALIGIAVAGSNVILPGVGTFIIGGPLVAALAGAGIGAASGGLIGALVGHGIPETEAREYTDRLERGHILVSVQASDARADVARGIFIDSGSIQAHAAH
jgi:hypothetical protein